MRFAMVIGMGMLLAAAGCNKNNAANGDAGATTAAVSGCGADWASPSKAYCVKVPAGYTPEVEANHSSLFSEVVNFRHPVDDQGHYPSFSIQVGWPSDPHKTFDETVKEKTADITNPRFKIEGTGPMKGGGMWWQYDQIGQMKRFESWTKTTDGTPIDCQAPAPPQDAMDACKSVRAYPK